MILFSLLGHSQSSDKIETYIQSILDYFFPDELDRHVEITITLVEHLEGYAGFCDGDTEEVNIDLALGEYVKSPSNNHKYEPYTHAELFRFLAHELVHAKQYIQGDLCSYSRTWKNSPMTEYYGTSIVPPWEQEAYELENSLFNEFFK